MRASVHRTRRPAAFAVSLLTFVVVGIAPAPASRAEDTAAASSLPAPPEAVQRLGRLAGRFEGTATYTAGGKTIEFTLRQESRLSAGGWGLETIESADSPDLGHYASVNIFGFDPGRGQMHLYSVTSLGECHDHIGNWLSDSQAYFREEGYLDGKPMIEEIPLTIVSANEYRFRSVTRVAGEVSGVLEATMKRQEIAMGDGAAGSGRGKSASSK